MGGAQNGASASPALSADGRYVAFESLAGLDPGDRNNDSDVYIFDVSARTTTLVSVTSKGQAANAAAGGPRFQTMVAWSRTSPSHRTWGRARDVHGQAATRIFFPTLRVHRATRCVARISGSSGAEWWTPSVAPAIDASGGTIVFSSAQPADADDPTTDFDLFHAVIGKTKTVNVYGDQGT